MTTASGLSHRSTRRIERDAAFADQLMRSEQLAALDIAELAERFRVASDDVARLAFAGTVAQRTLGLTPYPVQLLGAFVLNESAVLEMPTGEGKTLVAALAAALRHTSGPVHVATANEYLAERDATALRPFYDALGITVAYVASSADRATKRHGYRADVVYATLTTFGFDFLSDQLLPDPTDEIATGRYASLIVDEADNLLVDAATVPLVLAAPLRRVRNGAVIRDAVAAFVEHLTDLEVDVQRDLRTANLTPAGFDRLVEVFPPDATGATALEQDEVMHALRSALRARFVYQRDVDYIIVDQTAPGGSLEQAVALVDPETGRVQPDRRLRDGIHEAIEARERLAGVAIPDRPVDVVRASVTVPYLLGRYGHVAGMSGTAVADAKEFARSYGLGVVVLPPHRPSGRVDGGERIFASSTAKFAALLSEIQTRHATGQPVLVGCENVAEAELVSELLTAAGVEHRTLSARHHAQEASVISDAGSPGAVTVATTMAGRGVDIRLGGDPSALTSPAERAVWEQRAAHVRSLGGLAVIAATRFSSRRSDLQLRGRCGRQGDPGVTMGFVSMEDHVVAEYAGAAASKLLTTFSASVDGELTSVPSMHALIDRAQTRRESLTAAARKDLLEYDLPIRAQLDTFYRFRHGLTRASADTFAATVALPVWRRRLSELPPPPAAAPAQLAAALANTFPGQIPDPTSYQDRAQYLEALLTALLARLDNVFAVLDGDMEERARLIRAHLLSATDLAWAEHLEVLDGIRSRVSLATYAGIDPHDLFAEQAREAFESFSISLLERLTVLLLSLRLEPVAP